MLTDRTRAYVVAIVLDPRQKYHYFERNWRKNQLPNMQMKMESMFQEFHQQSEIPVDVAASAGNSQLSDEMLTAEGPLTKRAKFDDWMFGNWRFREEEERV